MNKVNTKPFNLHAWVAAGMKVSDLALDDAHMRTITAARVIGSENFPTGVVIDYDFFNKKYSLVFDAKGEVVIAKGNMKLYLIETNTPLEAANERLAEAEKKIAELKVNLAASEARLANSHEAIRAFRAENEELRRRGNDLSRAVFLKDSEIRTYINDLRACGKDFAAIYAIAQRTEAKYGTDTSMQKVQAMARDKRELIQTIRAIV